MENQDLLPKQPRTLPRKEEIVSELKEDVIMEGQFQWSDQGRSKIPGA